MITTLPLEYGKYYHIYNRGINGCDLFRDTDNFKHFLKLYEKYVVLIADTFAWVLMKNHFHFLVRIKDEKYIDFLPPLSKIADRSVRPCQDDKDKDPSGFTKPDGVLNSGRKPVPERQLGHLFNSYAKSFNKQFNRTGSLFERPFNRIEINHEDYLKILVSYIHHNPVHHGFTGKIIDYPWSSYAEVVSSRITKFQCREVIGWLFANLDEFREFHDQHPEYENFKGFLIERT